jgi:hypothetical protein
MVLWSGDERDWSGALETSVTGQAFQVDACVHVY